MNPEIPWLDVRVSTPCKLSWSKYTVLFQMIPFSVIQFSFIPFIFYLKGTAERLFFIYFGSPRGSSFLSFASAADSHITLELVKASVTADCSSYSQPKTISIDTNGEISHTVKYQQSLAASPG